MIRKIFALVSEEDFYAFRRRCYKEGIDKMGEGLAALVHAYAKGAEIDLPKFVPEKTDAKNQGAKLVGSRG